MKDIKSVQGHFDFDSDLNKEGTIQPIRAKPLEVKLINLNEEELALLVNLWRTAETLRHDFEKLYPTLNRMGSEYAGMIYSNAVERKHTLALSRDLLLKLTQHIPTQEEHNLTDEKFVWGLQSLRIF